MVATLKQQLDERQKIMTDFALEHGLAQIDKSEEKKEKQQPAKAAQGVLV